MEKKVTTWESGVRVETLGFLVNGNRVILATKTRKKGIGRLNGYGGGKHSGETLLECLAREIQVETAGVKIDPASAEKVAIAEFVNHNPDRTTLVCTVHVYIIRRWQGMPRSTAEMIGPETFLIEFLPVGRMFPSDALWVPRVLTGEYLCIHAEHSPGQASLVGEVQITKVSKSELGD